jgi:hypothetical protein
MRGQSNRGTLFFLLNIQRRSRTIPIFAIYFTHIGAVSGSKTH